MSAKTAELVKQSKKFGGPSVPITLNIANRLFAQKGYHFRETFLSLIKQNFGGAFEPIDFVADPGGATQRINKWVADQTRERIRDLIPEGALDKTTRLVLANALYLIATRGGPLGLVATLTSLYPASTVVLARVVLRERLRPVQSLGLACAVAAIVLITSR